MTNKKTMCFQDVFSFAVRSLRQTTSWEKQKNSVPIVPIIDSHRALSCESEPTNHTEEDGIECLETGNWSSDCSNSDDEDHSNAAIPVR